MIKPGDMVAHVSDFKRGTGEVKSIHPEEVDEKEWASVRWSSGAISATNLDLLRKL